jgi:1,2-diacylglycerol 3-beta-galactosyltransferase
MQKSFLINVVTGQGGGGHYATYHAIRAIAEQQQLPWQFQVTDMDAIITELSQQNQVKNAYEMFGFSGHDLYNAMVKNGWTWLWSLKMRLNKFLVKLNHDIGVEIFENYWREQNPDLVVSVMPLYNKGLWESLQRAKPGTPMVTVLTDFADCPPAFWIDPEIGNYLVCGTEKAVEQARLLGVEPARIVKTSGLVIHPNFCQARNSLVLTEFVSGFTSVKR